MAAVQDLQHPTKLVRMDSASKMPTQTSLFQVYLRLRPSIQMPVSKPVSESWLIVEPPVAPAEEAVETIPTPSATHITLQPPNDSRKRAIERFGFTKIFPEEASQLNIFEETGTAECVKGVLSDNRDGLIATLGVTGSGKSHTILGSKSQRGLTQMTLDMLFQSIGQKIRRADHPDLPTDTALLSALQQCDPSEAHIQSATSFLDSMYGDNERGRMSRAQTPMVGGGSRAQTPMVWHPCVRDIPGSFPIALPGVIRPSRLYSYLPKYDGVPQSTLIDQNVKAAETRALLHFNRLSTITKPTIRLLPTLHEESPKEAFVSPIAPPFWKRLASPQKKSAKPDCVKESIAPHTAPRRHLLPPRASALPQLPDVSSYSIETDSNTDYVVLVSMYEVYNDRIFDLLSSPTTNAPPMATRQGAALQKGMLRRPLLFKNTEMSPDRKVVAGLRKVICGSYEEAMMVLETGLTERRVAGTGSNSVSSRSHGFFCIEVQRKPSERSYYNLATRTEWTGSTLSIVDLAGSERARNAKTTGSTLAEAGKINESLMYLGQCLQVQSDCQQDGSKPIVPFRQCKLTELLFSNSFASNQPSWRTPQKAIMIVTADPQGDFNATSQILRYSALAREVTVPRIPSVTSTILGTTHNMKTAQSGRLTPLEAQFSAEELDYAAHEIARLSEECDHLAMKLTEEEIRKSEVELRLHAVEERLETVEQDVREQCWAEMEQRMEEEKYRWRQAWEEERLQGEKYLDGKIEIVEKSNSGFQIHEDAFGERMEEVERENEMLRAKVDALEREMQGKSPTKKQRVKGAEKTENKILRESDGNMTSNPFLASLQGQDKAGLGIQGMGKVVTLEVKTRTERVRVEDASPRKLSLRSSSAGSRIGGHTAIETESDNIAPASSMGLPSAAKPQRKLTARMRDLGGLDDSY